MDVLIAIVIVFFVIVGVYVGFHASQEFEENGKGYSISNELELLDQDSGLVQIIQNKELQNSAL
ncbi:MAG: hypothetical protein ACQ9CV_00715 [Nitrosopumilus sp.]|mgnify:CR=1 FL=1|jgi:hypothetical protein